GMQARGSLEIFQNYFENAPGSEFDSVMYKHLDSDQSQIYFFIKGRSDSPFEGGYFFGRFIFYITHGLEHMAFYTPNGRFPINRDILRDLYSMNINIGRPGSCSRMLRDILYSDLEENCKCSISDARKRGLASSSKAFNLRDETFRDLFSD
ncbi:hypothetical protein PENTCL1PPCAC_13736, partial [Pristionchus entomophagus]